MLETTRTGTSYNTYTNIDMTGAYLCTTPSRSAYSHLAECGSSKESMNSLSFLVEVDC